MRRRLSVAVLALCSLLSSCGQGGGDDSAETALPTVDASPEAGPRGPEELPNSGDVAIGCPAGSNSADGYCRLPCPDEWERAEDGTCQPPCPEGWGRFEGTCAPPCPEGQAPDGLLCRLPEESVGPLPCRGGGDYDLTGTAAGDLILYIHPTKGSAAGPGTGEDVPFATIPQALASLVDKPAALALVLGPGQYDAAPVPILGEQAETIRILGACADTVAITDLLYVSSQEATVEIARVSFDMGSVAITNALSVKIEDSLFSGPEGSFLFRLIGWSSQVPGGTLTVRRCRFDGGSGAIGTSGVLAAGRIEHCRFGGSQLGAVSAEESANLVVANNWFDGPAVGSPSSAIMLAAKPDQDVKISVSGNWIGAGYRSGISMKALSGKVQIADNSITGCDMSFISGIMLGGGGDPRGDPYPVEISGNRLIAAGNAASGAAVMVTDSAGIKVSNCVVVGAPGAGLEFNYSRTLRVENTVVHGCAGAGIQAMGTDGDSGLEVTGTTLVGNDRGVFAHDGGSVLVSSSRIAGCARQGIAMVGAHRVEIVDNVLATNGSTGIDLTSLQGGPETTHVVSRNISHESKGLGILVRAGGQGKVLLDGNTASGTRPGQVSNAQYANFQVGDGIAVLTGADGVASVVEMMGENRVDTNARLGVLAHGEGTAVTVRQPVLFGGGNGYLGILGEPPTGLSWDLVKADGAHIESAGQAVAAAEVPAPDSTALGGGGDPR